MFKDIFTRVGSHPFVAAVLAQAWLAIDFFFHFKSLDPFKETNAWEGQLV